VPGGGRSGQLTDATGRGGGATSRRIAHCRERRADSFNLGREQPAKQHGGAKGRAGNAKTHNHTCLRKARSVVRTGGGATGLSNTFYRPVLPPRVPLARLAGEIPVARPPGPVRREEGVNLSSSSAPGGWTARPLNLGGQLLGGRTAWAGNGCPRAFSSLRREGFLGIAGHEDHRQIGF